MTETAGETAPETAGEPGAETAGDLLRALYRVRAFERAAERVGRGEHHGGGAGTHAPAPHALVAPTAVAIALTSGALPTGALTSGEGPDLLTLRAGATGASILRGLPARELARHRPGGDASGHPTRHALGLIGPVPSSGVSVSVAAGAALAFALRGESRIAVVVDRGTAIESGGWHEGFSVAAARGAPLVAVLLHDAPSAGRRAGSRAGSRAALRRGEAYGVRSERIATDSAEEMARRLDAVLGMARNERGTHLVEVDPLPADAVARLEARVIDRARLERWSAEADAEALDAWRGPEASA